MNQTLGDSEKLAFYRDYLIRARTDAMQDKASLTTIMNIKLTVFGVVLVLMARDIGLIGVAFLPIIMFSLDLIHKSRFEEIFSRWRYISKYLAGEIKKLPGVGGFEFFEDEVYKNKKVFQSREAWIRTIVTALSLLLSVAALLLLISLKTDASSFLRTSLCIGWLGLLFAVFIGLFFFQKQNIYGDTYVKSLMFPWFVLLFFGVLLSEQFGIVNFLVQLSYSAPP